MSVNVKSTHSFLFCQVQSNVFPRILLSRKSFGHFVSESILLRSYKKPYFGGVFFFLQRRQNFKIVMMHAVIFLAFARIEGLVCNESW